MLLQTQVLLLTAAIVVSSVATASVSLPGCPSKCGNIDVPYPFGLTLDCSLDEGFQLSCFDSRLFSNVNLELETIYLSSGRARAYGSMFLECDRGASVNPNWPQQIDLTSSPPSAAAP
ncbi:wall-associated receptor kinase 2-like [Canna indica]|uniref:Wall-associated receptor kinase 2-like n=1 Tax=Canna indica TaxID=4628 RepID=A0AAQ3KJ21_9LILI|nr:wall-associated receptor kinase 2-like [Canna indica]